MKDYDIDYDTEFVYDDDAIKLLSKALNIKNNLADKYRRCLSKNKWNNKDKINYLNFKQITL